MMTIPRITIALFFFFGMLTGCETPFIDVSVDVHSGLQPGISHLPGRGGCHTPTMPWLCGGGAQINKGVLEAILGNDEAKVYVVGVEGHSRKLYFTNPPDDVQTDLAIRDVVVFKEENYKKFLRKAE